MLFSVDTTWLITMLLVTIRLGVLFYATPFDAIGKLPVQIRVLTTFILAAMLTSFLDLSSSVMPTSIPALVAFGIHELIVGLVMAFGLYCVFGSIMVAGKLIDFQAGFGAAQILNPSTNAASPLIGTALSLFAVVLFFVSNAYQLAIRGIAWSLTVSPPGSALSGLNMVVIVKQFGLTYIYGIIIAAPVVGTLLLIDTGIAVMGRSMPQMNVYFLFLPLKIGVALILTAIAVRYLSPVLEQLFLTSFRYWQQVV